MTNHEPSTVMTCQVCRSVNGNTRKPDIGSGSMCQRWGILQQGALAPMVEYCGRAGSDSFRFILLQGEAEILVSGIIYQALTSYIIYNTFSGKGIVFSTV